MGCQLKSVYLAPWHRHLTEISFHLTFFNFTSIGQMYVCCVGILFRQLYHNNFIVYKCEWMILLCSSISFHMILSSQWIYLIRAPSTLWYKVDINIIALFKTYSVRQQKYIIKWNCQVLPCNNWRYFVDLPLGCYMICNIFLYECLASISLNCIKTDNGIIFF